MRRLSFAENAEQSLVSIFGWTLRNFGPEQARRYRTLLGDVCLGVAAGTTPHRSCREIFAPDLRQDLRFARASRHIVVFILREQDVLIVDFLHQSSDLERRLGEIGGEE